MDHLIEGLIDGTIDCISSAHEPVKEYEKNVEYDLAPSGVTSLETAFNISLKVLSKHPKFTWISTGDEVRYKELFYFFIRLGPCKFLKPKPIFAFVKCLHGRTTFTTVFVIVILVFREVILHRQVTAVGIKRHHQKTNKGIFCRKIFSDKNEIKEAIWRGNFASRN